MRATQLNTYGVSDFKATALELPALRPNEVLINLTAASLNAIDLMVIQGYFPGMPLPFIPICDGAGVVSAIGNDVSGIEVGARVIPHFMPDWVDGPLTPKKTQRKRGVTMMGSLADYIAVPMDAIVDTPAFLSDKEASTLPIAATTAWRAIRDGRVGPGSIVVLLGTGVVSLFALQLAKAAGAYVIVTSASDEKLEMAKRHGADVQINYMSNPGWASVVMDVTNGQGADVIVETGGAGTFAQSISAIRPNGTILAIGVLTGHELSVNAYELLQKQIVIRGISTGSVADLKQAVAALERNAIHPIIDSVLDRENVGEAIGRLISGQAFGKVVLEAKTPTSFKS
ncbi:MAG: NAD(P)-dependent alcohol dehydrogenase [Deltaproteobacteria bacterium]|nr:NAD(P)-dependent alcohol dehydrogenase [Deltaproteobacteria bacterium]